MRNKVQAKEVVEAPSEGPISVIGVVANNSIDYVRAIFDCYKRGEVVLPLKDPDSQKLIMGLNVSGTVNTSITSGWARLGGVLPTDERIAQISFTSGTEGLPKGVLLSHRALASVSSRLNKVMEVTPDIREYIGVPLTYSFGLGRCRAVTEAGGEFYLPPHGFDPLEIRRMLVEGSVNAISAVPTLWRVLLRATDIFGKEAELVRWIEIGSQYMSGSEKEALRALFPKAVIVQHYGLTEASRSTILRIDSEPKYRLESVGSAVGDSAVSISESGRILVKGPHVVSKLLVAGKVQSCLNQDGWYQTGDLGHIDQDGYLYFDGRADDLINCGGVKISPDAFEVALRERLNIEAGVAVARVHDDRLGNAVLIAYNPSVLHCDETVLRDESIAVAGNLGISNRSALHFLSLEEFPETATGKTKRNELVSIFEARSPNRSAADLIGNDGLEVHELTSDEQEVAKVWGEVLGTKITDPKKSFSDLGGDSLTALTAVVDFERRGIDHRIAQGMLQGLSISEVAASLGKLPTSVKSGHQVNSNQSRMSMTINIVRGVLVACVVFAHWSGGIFSRLPKSLDFILPYLAPILASGTPGFAVIYGVSVGYSVFPIFQSDRQRFNRLVSQTARFLGVGILILGLAIFYEKSLESAQISFTDFTNSFYSVLTFYFLMTITLRFVLGLLARSKNPMITSFGAGVVCYAIHHFVVRPYGELQLDGVFEFIKLLLTAKYAYFNMLTGVLIGISVGILFQDASSLKLNLSRVVVIGFTSVVLAVIVASHAGEAAGWWVWPVASNQIWRWMLYFGLVLVGLVIVFHWLETYNNGGRVARLPAQLLSILGMLAFPMFLAHGLVLHVKNILIMQLGMPPAMALGLSILAFIWGVYFLFSKFYKVAFAG